MTEENIKKYISTMLGGSKLNIELDEQDFKEIIQHALEVQTIIFLTFIYTNTIQKFH